jgi:hypothetical protein
MAQAPNTLSTLTRADGSNLTSTGLSTNIVIKVNNTVVGAIQTLTVNEKRQVRQIDEVGSDGHVDSAPNKSTNISGTCQRVRFDGIRVAEAFSRGFVHVSAQAYPFDIVIYDKSRRDSANHIITIIKNVWITGIDVTYSVSDWVIVENMTWEAETISSSLSGGQSAVTGGVRGVQHVTITEETEADTGGRRGALDAGGLIDLGDNTTLY